MGFLEMYALHLDLLNHTLKCRAVKRDIKPSRERVKGGEREMERERGREREGGEGEEG